MVAVITSLQDFKTRIASDKYTVVDFWATWCGPCRVISPVFASMEPAFPDVAFCKVDVDEQPEVSQEMGIRAMPTFILFKNGEKVKELVGANPPALQALINETKA